MQRPFRCLDLYIEILSALTITNWIRARFIETEYKFLDALPNNETIVFIALDS